MSDDSFSGIFTSCVEDPQNCALAASNVTAAQLEDAVWDFIETIKYKPIALGTFLLDYTFVKQTIQHALYGTNSWPALTAVFGALLLGNTEGLATTTPPTGVSAEAMASTMATIGIHCSDRTYRESSYEKILPEMQKLIGTSRIVGDITTQISMICAHWKMPAKEIYQGDFHVKTQKPVLIIGNTHDAFTPIVSAHNLSSTFEDSVVLEVNGYGVSRSGLLQMVFANMLELHSILH